MLSAFKNFFVTVLIALVIFGIAAYFATMFVTDTMSSIMKNEKEQLSNIIDKVEDDPEVSPETQPVQSGTVSPVEIEGDSFTFFLVLTDYRPDYYEDYLPEAGDVRKDAEDYEEPYDGVGVLSRDYRTGSAAAMVLIRGDKEERQYTYTYLSPLLRVSTPTGYHTLGEVYTYYGEERLTEYVHALTGITPDFRFVLEGYKLDDLLRVLGPVTLNVTKDIYFDGKEYTTEYEYTKKSVNESGEEYTEHIPNTFSLGKGAVQLNEWNIQILNSLTERSAADAAVKEAFTVEAVRQYMTLLGGMDEETLYDTVVKLTLNETVTVPELPAETEAETEPPQTENPWWNSESGIEEEPEKTEKPRFTDSDDIPVLRTGFYAEDVASYVGVLQAIPAFESVTLSYPMEFEPASETAKACFKPQLEEGIKLFLKYRQMAGEKQ